MLVNANIDSSAAIAISKLAASTISGKALGTTLAAVTQGNGISTFSYDGSTARTIQLQLSGGANSALVLDAGGVQLAASIPGNRTFSADLTVTGDFTVNGTTTTVATTNLVVEDDNITIRRWFRFDYWYYWNSSNTYDG